MTILKHLTVVALLSTATATLAAGDPVAGEEKAALCAGCHGDDGNATAPIFPKLAGQHRNFLIKQLHEFKSHKRVEATMNAMAEPLSEEDIQDLAAFYATKKITPESGALNTKGESLYKAGSASAGIPACSGCHGPHGEGNPSAGFPSLRGQYSAYIEKTLADFKSGERANDPNGMMRQIASHLSEEDMNALGDYVSTLK